MKKTEKLFAEINNQEIKYAVFQLSNNSSYNLITKKNSENIGIQKGVVVDHDKAAELVSKDLKEIEKKFDRVFDDISLLINQRDMSSTNITSFKKLNGAQVEKRDIDYVLNEGKISISKNQEKNSIIHILNSNYYLDKKKREKMPLNVVGDHLGLQLTLILLPKNNIKNIINLFEANDLRVDRLLCRPLTTGINIASKNQNTKNFFLINIDDEVSSISIYENSSPVFFKTFAFGTNSIYKDISQLCTINNNEIKTIINEINLEKNILDKNRYLDRKYFKESQFTKLRISLIKEIVESRIKEMMQYLFNQNTNINYFKNRISHIYLVFEDEIFRKNLGEIFKSSLNFDTDINSIQLINQEDHSLFGAAELIFNGWHSEAIPYEKEKKSLFTGLFSRFFS